MTPGKMAANFQTFASGASSAGAAGEHCVANKDNNTNKDTNTILLLPISKLL
jgi:hypothetical protein